MHEHRHDPAGGSSVRGHMRGVLPKINCVVCICNIVLVYSIYVVLYLYIVYMVYDICVYDMCMRYVCLHMFVICVYGMIILLSYSYTHTIVYSIIY